MRIKNISPDLYRRNIFSISRCATLPMAGTGSPGVYHSSLRACLVPKGAELEKGDGKWRGDLAADGAMGSRPYRELVQSMRR